LILDISTHEYLVGMAHHPLAGRGVTQAAAAAAATGTTVQLAGQTSTFLLTHMHVAVALDHDQQRTDS